MFRKKDKNQGIPDGVVGNNLKNARLTKKEREEIATTERKRIRKQMEAEAERYQIIKSTQRIIPVEDIFNGVIITKDHRYVKVMEYRPINFAYMDAETQNRVISLFYQTFKAVPCNIQFKTFARKADVESTISNVTQYYEQETNPKRKKMLNAYIGLLRKTALSVGITRRFFVVIEFQKTISNDGSRFELVVADLNAMAANVRSHMEQCGNVFIPALGNPDRNEDAGIHQLFYQLLNRSKSETVSFHDHMQPIIDRYSEAEMQGVKTSLQAPELIAPEWIDFTHYNYIVIDGKFYTFAYIPSTGYNQRVYAGWIATFVNAGEGIDVDMFFEHMSREAVYNKISTQLRMSRANAMDSHDTDSDYHARMEKISSSEYMLRGLSTGEDFYYMSMVITVVADSVDELEYKYDNLEKRVKGQGMKIRRANFMMEECFESALLPLGKLNKDIKRKAQRKGLLFLSDELSATIKATHTVGEEYTTGRSRLVGIIINCKGIFFIYCTLDKLMRWIVSYEHRRADAITKILKDSDASKQNADFNYVCSLMYKSVIIGKTCAMIPKIITGNKYGKAVTNPGKNGIADNLLTLTNLEQVYARNYFVPTNTLGVELLSRTVTLTRDDLNQMIEMWLSEMTNTHTCVDAREYTEAYIDDDSEKTLIFPIIELEELVYQKAGREKYHIVCERGIQDGISRTMGNKVIDFKDMNNEPMPAHKYDDAGIRRDGINPLTHSGYWEGEP